MSEPSVNHAAVAGKSRAMFSLALTGAYLSSLCLWRVGVVPVDALHLLVLGIALYVVLMLEAVWASRSKYSLALSTLDARTGLRSPIGERKRDPLLLIRRLCLLALSMCLFMLALVVLDISDFRLLLGAVAIHLLVLISWLAPRPGSGRRAARPRRSSKHVLH
jgi:hypothetical protein